jgi:bifunctional UDP-N-acetylglucosamine pyrophosphorylase/glucosamine-1-phosphate N-acetyltransferase
MAASSGKLLNGLIWRLTTDNAKGEKYLTDVIGLAHDDGIVCAAAEADAETLLGVNTRADLAVAEATMQTRLRGAAMAAGVTLVDPTTVYLSFDTRLGRDVVVGPHVWFGPGVTVGKGVEIRPYCHIEGATIGADAIIGPFARLRPGADIGAESHIGNFVEVKEACVEVGAKINHLTYIGDARVGAGANIGAGTITCNYDGFEKHWTEIGAGAFIGSNTAMVAPVVIGDGAVIGAGSVITDDVPADNLAVARGEQKTVPGGGTKYRAEKSQPKSGKLRGKTVSGKG